MIEVKKIIVGELKANCYVVFDKNSLDAIIIDAGAEPEKIYNFICENKLKIKAVLLTHGHFDHIGACCFFKEMGVPIYIHMFDADKCMDNNLNLSNSFSNNKLQTFEPDFLLADHEQSLKFCEISIKAIHTPGHSEGGVTYIIDNYLFSGDTIFACGYGRTDFYDGSMQKLRQSVKALKPYLQRGYVLCAGH